jgi:hypothetical protein
VYVKKRKVRHNQIVIFHPHLSIKMAKYNAVSFNLAEKKDYYDASDAVYERGIL